MKQLRRAFNVRRLAGVATALLVAVGALIGVGGVAGAATATLSPGTYEETSATFGGGWQQGCGQGQSGGCDRWSSTPGSSYQIGFRGTGIAVFGAKAFNGGQIAFNVDGASSATVDSYSAQRVDGAEYYRVSGLAQGEHRLTATMLSTRNRANTANPIYVTLDRFSVAGTTTYGPGYYEEDAASFGSGWQQGCGLGQSGGCDRWTSTPGSSYTITFDNPSQNTASITIYGAMAFNGGQMSLTIDDERPVLVDTYRAQRLDQAVLWQSFKMFAVGPHKLTVTMLAGRNPANTQPTAYVTLDRFAIRPTNTVADRPMIGSPCSTALESTTALLPGATTPRATTTGVCWGGRWRMNADTYGINWPCYGALPMTEFTSSVYGAMYCHPVVVDQYRYREDVYVGPAVPQGKATDNQTIYDLAHGAPAL